MIKTKRVYIESNSIQRLLVKMLITLVTDFTKKYRSPLTFKTETIKT